MQNVVMIGIGNMGGAILDGLSYGYAKITAVYKKGTDEKRINDLKEKYQRVIFSSTIPTLTPNDIVILAIKPQVFEMLEPSLFVGKAGLVISVMAGTKLDSIKSKIDANYYTKAMPNMAAEKSCSTTVICGDDEGIKIAYNILKTIGDCYVLSSEEELDIATPLCGCAPAWLSVIIEAMSDEAVHLGLSRALSYELIISMLKGTANMLETTHPAVLKDQITSPKGVTIKGNIALEDANIRNIFMKAVRNAHLHSSSAKKTTK